MVLNIIVFVILLYFLINAIVMSYALKIYGREFDRAVDEGATQSKCSKKVMRNTMLRIGLMWGLPLYISSSLKNHSTK